MVDYVHDSHGEKFYRYIRSSMKENTTPIPITVQFAPGIRSDGEQVCVSIQQDDNKIQLTMAQVISLVEQLEAKYNTLWR